MADKTGIEWTDATWNPVTGCSKVSQGCKNCYALRDWPRMSANPKTVYYGRKFTDVMCHPERLDQPFRWAKPSMIFVNSMSDLFHPDVPFDFIADVFGVIAEADWHIFQVLTKRPERMLEFFALHGNHAAPKNAWLGVSIEDQKTANERIPLLLTTPTVVRWVSAEPLIEPVDLTKIRVDENAILFPLAGEIHCDGRNEPAPINGGGIGWVVVGGESGQTARQMHPDWVRSLRDQCAAAGVPFLFKQWGEWAPVGPIYSDDDTDEHMAALDCDPDEPRQCWISPSGQIEDGGHQPPIGTWAMRRIGKKAAGRLLEGVLHNGYPKDKV